MAKMIVKDDSINIWGLELPMKPVLHEAAKIWESLGQTLVVTSARDGMHSPGSYHYYGYAVDMRTRYFDDKGEEAGKRLKEVLSQYSNRYVVIVEKTHIHVQYNALVK